MEQKREATRNGLLGAGNDLFLDLGDVYKGVALQLLSNCMFYALFTFLSVVSELKGH